MKKVNSKLKKANNLFESHEYKKSKEICKKNFDNPRFKSIYIKSLIEERNIDEAKRICNENLDFPSIASQYVSILIRENNINEARKVCESYNQTDELKAEYIRVLSHYNDREKITEIYNRYPYDRFVCKAYIRFLVSIKEFDEAIKICKKNIIDKEIQLIYTDLLSRMPDKKEDKDNDRIISKIYDKALILMYSSRFEEAKKICKDYIYIDEFSTLYMNILIREKNSKKYTLKYLNND